MSNQYNSVKETFTANPLLNIVLGTKATPPDDLSLVLADFTPADMYALTAAGLSRGNLEINDVPRLLGVGIWCNLAGGMVQNDSIGLSLRFQWQSYNGAGVLQQTDIFTPSVDVNVTEFNTIFPMDQLFDASGLQANITTDTLAFTRIHVSWLAATSDFSLVSMNPDFSVKQLIIRPVAIIEHSRPTKTAGF